jgi:hypothetical protein
MLNSVVVVVFDKDVVEENDGNSMVLLANFLEVLLMDYATDVEDYYRKRKRMLMKY